MGDLADNCKYGAPNWLKAPSWERRRLAGNILSVNKAVAQRLHSMSRLLSFSFIHAGKGRRFQAKSYTVLAVSADILSSLPARRRRSQGENYGGIR